MSYVIGMFTKITMSELRARLSSCWREVRFGNTRFACTHYGEVMAFLLPVEEAKEVQKTLEFPVADFRCALTEAYENLLDGTDCVYLTFHGRRVAAFVSPRCRLD